MGKTRVELECQVGTKTRGTLGGTNQASLESKTRKQALRSIRGHDGSGVDVQNSSRVFPRAWVIIRKKIIRSWLITCLFDRSQVTRKVKL